MSTRPIGFDIFAKDRASKVFDKVGNSADDSAGKLSKFGSAAGKVAKVAAIGLAAGAVVAGKAMFDMGKAAIADEAAQKKLATQLRNSAGATDEQIASTEEWITKTGKMLGVADDDLRPALARLATATKDVGKAQDLAALAMDVSAGTGKSLKSVTEALMKAQNGQVSGLSRLGIATKDAKGKTLEFDEVVGKMASTFNGQAVVAADTTEGKFKRLKLQFDETKEAIGAKLIPIASDLADFLLTKMGPALGKAGTWAKDHLLPPLQDVGGFIKDKVIPTAREFGEKVLTGLRGFIDNVSDALKDNKPFLDSLSDAFKKVAEFVGSKVIPVLGSIAEKVLPALGKGIGIAITVISKISSVLLKMAEFGVKAFRFLLNAAFATFGGILNAAAKGLGWIPGLGGKIKSAASDFEEFKSRTITALDKTGAALKRTQDKINGVHSPPPIEIKVTFRATNTLQQAVTSAGGGRAGGQSADSLGGLLGGTPRALADTGRTVVGYATAVGRGFEQVVAKLTKTGVKLNAAGASLIENLVAGIDKKRVSLTTVMGKLASFIQKQGQRLADLLAKRRDVMSSFGEFTSSVFTAPQEEGTAPTVSSLLAFQQEELAKALKLKADTAKLLKMGLSRDLIDQLASSGDAGIAQISALAQGSADEIRRLNELNAQTQAALGGTGAMVGDALFGSDIKAAQRDQKLAQAIAKELRKLRDEEDRNTKIMLVLDGKVIHTSLLKRKREIGANLGLT